MKHFFEYDSPVSTIRIIDNGEAIISIKFLDAHPNLPSETEEKETPLIQEAFKQLSEYFVGKRTVFDVPVDAQGTEFQKRVWDALCTIPYGETRSYKQIASLVHCPKGARAIGMANNRNPVSIIIPCHRVIGADGSLTGYASGLSNKQKLLQIESAKK
jgi:methylated-DNA-[protein]-cysteine S-methyltransferase